MNIFSKSGSIALYINKSGLCCGVQWSSAGELLNVGTKKLSLADADSELDRDRIQQLVAELSPKDDQPVLVSLHNLGSSVDLEMPNLPPANLQKALEFEIPKLTPLNEDCYTWGYRIVENRGDQGLMVRVSILKTSVFEQMIDLVSKVEGGVEMILPVEQAVHGSIDFIITEHKIAFAKDELGFRKIKFQPTGSYSDALAEMKIDQSRVDGESLESLYKPVILAKYALESNLRKDVKSWIQLPRSIYTTKKRNLKLINVIVLLVLVALWGWSSYLFVAQDHEVKAVYQKHISQLEKKLSDVKVGSVSDEAIKKIQAQMDQALRNRPGVANLLAEATNVISDDFWCEKFRFDGERLVLSMVSSKQGQEIGSVFQDSEVFTVDAVRSQARSNGGESITLELLVNETHLDDLKEEGKK